MKSVSHLQIFPGFVDVILGRILFCKRQTFFDESCFIGVNEAKVPLNQNIIIFSMSSYVYFILVDEDRTWKHPRFTRNVIVI